jgi:hypothetical protein
MIVLLQPTQAGAVLLTLKSATLTVTQRGIVGENIPPLALYCESTVKVSGENV